MRYSAHRLKIALLLYVVGHIFGTINCHADCIVEFMAGHMAEGLKEMSINGMEYCAYLGIPYAKPPIDERRLKPPEPYEPWTGCRQFINESKSCYQLPYDKNTVGEDCLYLNVYTPKTTRFVDGWLDMATVIWIHGGSYTVGSGTSDGMSPDYFIESSIIVVTINYRLGVLGFDFDRTKNITGNFGLRDQRLAMKWTYNNIRIFGGNNTNITLMGWSAGSASITYHLYMEPEPNRNLYQRAILMSGTMLAPWAFTRNTTVCSTDNYFKFFGTKTYCFGPVVDMDIIDYEPNDLIMSNRTPTFNVPIIIGITSNESVYDNKSFEIENIVLPLKNRTLINEILNYLQNDSTYESVNNRYDFLYILQCIIEEGYSTINFATLYGERSSQPVYMYKFNVIGKLNGKSLGEKNGALHGDDLGYLFASYVEKYMNTGKSVSDIPDEMEVVRQMTALWTNFIKFGNPTHQFDNDFKWLPYTKRSPHRLNINWNLTMERNWFEQSPEHYRIAYNLWNKIYKCLYRFDCIDILKQLKEKIILS